MVRLVGGRSYWDLFLHDGYLPIGDLGRGYESASGRAHLAHPVPENCKQFNM